MTIYATCGHEVTTDTEVHLRLKTTVINYSENRIVAAVSFGTYCQACADEFERDGWVLHNEAEEEAYRRSEKSEWRTL